MKITKVGFVNFETETEKEGILSLIEKSFVKGWVDTGNPLFRKWMDEYGLKQNLKNDILTWVTVFIPKLMWSAIQDYRGIDA